jgi:hypothetical protein
VSTAFERAVDARYANNDTTVDAIYRALGTGPETPVRLKLNRPDEEITLGRSALRLSTTVGRVRTSEVPDLALNDTFTVGDDTWKVKGRDRGPRRLEWVIDFKA